MYERVNNVFKFETSICRNCGTLLRIWLWSRFVVIIPAVRSCVPFSGGFGLFCVIIVHDVACYIVRYSRMNPGRTAADLSTTCEYSMWDSVIFSSLVVVSLSCDVEDGARAHGAAELITCHLLPVMDFRRTCH